MTNDQKYGHDRYMCVSSCKFFVLQRTTKGGRKVGICEASGNKVVTDDFAHSYAGSDYDVREDSRDALPATDCEPALAELRERIARQKIKEVLGRAKND